MLWRQTKICSIHYYCYCIKSLSRPPGSSPYAALYGAQQIPYFIQSGNVILKSVHPFGTTAAGVIFLVLYNFFLFPLWPQSAEDKILLSFCELHSSNNLYSAWRTGAASPPRGQKVVYLPESVDYK